jgi:hypothetical protein
MLLALPGCEGTPQGFIPERVSCRGCRIAMDVVATIGDSTGDSGLTGRPLAVKQDQSGRYWINVLDAFPLMLDPAEGGLVEFARRGEGPREYRHPAVRAVLPGDSILVSDMYEYSVLAPDLELVRRFATREDIPRIEVLAWPTNVLGLTARFDPGSGRFHLMILRYDMSGERAFVTDTLFAPATGGEKGREADDYRILGAPFHDGSIWVSDFNRYYLVKYSPDGEPLDSIQRSPRWFPGGEPVRRRGPDERTSPHMVGSWLDVEGRLWTLAAKPREDTRAAWEGVADVRAGLREVRASALPAVYQLNRTMIEVIDLTERRVMARLDFDGYIIDVLPNQRVASFRETPLGIPIMTIHRLGLQQ